ETVNAPSCSGPFYARVGHQTTCIGDLLAVLIGVEVDDPAAANADHMGAFVLIRRSRSRRGVTEPLDRDEDVPRRTGDDHSFDVERELIKAEHSFKPA